MNEKNSTPFIIVYPKTHKTENTKKKQLQTSKRFFTIKHHLNYEIIIIYVQ